MRNTKVLLLVWWTRYHSQFTTHFGWLTKSGWKFPAGIPHQLLSRYTRSGPAKVSTTESTLCSPVHPARTSPRICLTCFKIASRPESSMEHMLLRSRYLSVARQGRIPREMSRAEMFTKLANATRCKPLGNGNMLESSCTQDSRPNVRSFAHLGESLLVLDWYKMASDAGVIWLQQTRRRCCRVCRHGKLVRISSVKFTFSNESDSKAVNLRRIYNMMRYICRWQTTPSRSWVINFVAPDRERDKRDLPTDFPTAKRKSASSHTGLPARERCRKFGNRLRERNARMGSLWGGRLSFGWVYVYATRETLRSY